MLIEIDFQKEKVKNHNKILRSIRGKPQVTLNNNLISIDEGNFEMVAWPNPDQSSTEDKMTLYLDSIRNSQRTNNMRAINGNI